MGLVLASTGRPILRDPIDGKSSGQQSAVGCRLVSPLHYVPIVLDNVGWGVRSQECFYVPPHMSLFGANDPLLGLSLSGGLGVR